MPDDFYAPAPAGHSCENDGWCEDVHPVVIVATEFVPDTHEDRRGSGIWCIYCGTTHGNDPYPVEPTWASIIAITL